MEVHCAGCAGCCMDWTALLDDHEMDQTRQHGRGRFADASASADSESERRPPFDSDANFVPLTRNEVRAFLEKGMAAAMTPRFWHAHDEHEAVEIDGQQVAAIAGRPVFFVGLRKPPKPVAPFGRAEPTWLPTCVFLDPTTLQCRIHDDEQFPAECGVYPAHNLELGHETECERVEEAFGDDRLLDDQLSANELGDGPLLGSQAVGEKLFCHPRPDDLAGIIKRLEVGTLRPEDRAECIAVASASSPGTFAISEHHYETGKARAMETMTSARGGDSADSTPDSKSWVGPAIDDWHEHYDTAAHDDGSAPSPDLAVTVEEDRGAPKTPGWVDGEGEVETGTE
ncbi:hypothetical protein C482_01570 [Natrialba chahannaoensis JCM 10990]|uniref:Zinc/iron-chelating domain-containing protein n=1 Tax=Natrialba chahannaoensis JCM 10990 TaxID=1227492 RepID=M0B6D6_9EURY|nr:zinc/iron-chelating domain-containing protein [Natrialba chahannaoensis]ELZ06466.1 hypothetical protein C482_01570 [Natrialba chahannaoensis JCM 10990]